MLAQVGQVEALARVLAEQPLEQVAQRRLGVGRQSQSDRSAWAHETEHGRLIDDDVHQIERIGREERQTGGQAGVQRDAERPAVGRIGGDEAILSCDVSALNDGRRTDAELWRKEGRRAGALGRAIVGGPHERVADAKVDQLADLAARSGEEDVVRLEARQSMAEGPQQRVSSVRALARTATFSC